MLEVLLSSLWLLGKSHAHAHTASAPFWLLEVSLLAPPSSLLPLRRAAGPSHSTTLRLDYGGPPARRGSRAAAAARPAPPESSLLLLDDCPAAALPSAAITAAGGSVTSS